MLICFSTIYGLFWAVKALLCYFTPIVSSVLKIVAVCLERKPGLRDGRSSCQRLLKFLPVENHVVSEWGLNQIELENIINRASLNGSCGISATYPVFCAFNANLDHCYCFLFMKIRCTMRELSAFETDCKVLFLSHSGFNSSNAGRLRQMDIHKFLLLKLLPSLSLSS